MKGTSALIVLRSTLIGADILTGMVSRENVPWAMVWLRVLLGPVLLLAAHSGLDGRWLAGIVLIALLDDIFDGILARRWGCETATLRCADSNADTAFYLCVAATLWMREKHLVRASWKILVLLAAVELLRHGFDQIKFKRAASYHSYLAKAWGLVMGLAVVAVLYSGGRAWMIWLSAAVGIAADTEGLAMSLILPRWQHNVKSISAAWILRQKMLQDREGFFQSR
jgi:phosphatidylglycerophosphate synthase